MPMGTVDERVAVFKEIATAAIRQTLVAAEKYMEEEPFAALVAEIGMPEHILRA
jgi:hypothetical protein